MMRTRTLSLVASFLAICLMLITALSVVSANAPPDPKFVIIADSLIISDDGEIQVETDDWIRFDATSSNDADGKIMYYRWDIKLSEEEYYTGDDDTVYRDVDTGEASLKIRFTKEGTYTIILKAGDDGTEGEQETAEFRQTIEVKEKEAPVTSLFCSLILLVLVAIFGVAIATKHFVRGVLVTGREKEKPGRGKKEKAKGRGKKGRGKGRKRASAEAPRRRKAAVAQPPAGAAAAAPEAASFKPPEQQINLQPYRERLQGWEQMNVDVSPLTPVFSDAEAGKIGTDVLDTQFANFDRLIGRMNELKMSVNEWRDVTGFDNEIREIMIFNRPVEVNELEAKMRALSEKIEESKRKAAEAAANLDIKFCAKCHSEMQVPKARPIEVRCPACGQRHIYKKKKK